jgi:hypothetical protein
MKRKGCGSKRRFPNLRYYPEATNKKNEYVNKTVGLQTEI